MENYEEKGKLNAFIFFLVVLNEKQRIAKRKLIEDNRERRKKEVVQSCTSSLPSSSKSDCSSVGSSEGSLLSDADQAIISAVVQAFEKSGTSSADSPVSLP